MKKIQKKRVISWLLCLAMLAGLLPGFSLRAKALTVDGSSITMEVGELFTETLNGVYSVVNANTQNDVANASVAPIAVTPTLESKSTLTSGQDYYIGTTGKYLKMSGTDLSWVTTTAKSYDKIVYVSVGGSAAYTQPVCVPDGDVDDSCLDPAVSTADIKAEEAQEAGQVTTYSEGSKITSFPSTGTPFYIKSGDDYMTCSSTGTLGVTTDVQEAAIWYGDSSSHIYCKVGTSTYYLNANKSNNASLTASGSASTTYSMSSSALRRGTGSYYIRWTGSGWTVSSTSSGRNSVYNVVSTTKDVPERAAKTTITFHGKQVGVTYLTVGDTTYMVVVRDKSENPDYPNEGAVRLEKTVESNATDYANTGVARIDLSVTGTPLHTPIDVLLVIDASGSMDNSITATSSGANTRLKALREDVPTFLDTLLAPYADGTEPDIDVAALTFHSWTKSVGTVQQNTSTIASDTGNYQENTNFGKNGAANAIIPFESLTADTKSGIISDINSFSTGSCTNYDAAMELAYEMLSAKKAENEANGENRQQFVVFLTDGAPNQYNFYHLYDGGSGSTTWNDFLLGKYIDNYGNDTGLNPDFYGQKTLPDYVDGSGNTESGQTVAIHWMSEAIKGEPGMGTTGATPGLYKILHTTTDSSGTITGAEVREAEGLGATVFSIGYYLTDADQVTVATIEKLLRGMASDTVDGYYTEANAENLKQTFRTIAGAVKMAATNAVFEDKMGAEFDVRFDTVEVDGVTKPSTITYSVYDLYTADDYRYGDITDESLIGTRKKDAHGEDIVTVMETVTLTGNGSGGLTSAASNKKSGNIYNSTANAIEASYFTYDLDEETFTWNVGDITPKEKVLSYYVYLTGSQEGTRAEGVYDTNEYAEISYSNYLGHTFTKTAPTPSLPWKAAVLRYAFYLVDKDSGVPVNSAGSPVPFTERVRLTEPQVWSIVYFNSSSETVNAHLTAQELLERHPDYTLYNGNANYMVYVKTDNTGYWAITDDGKSVEQSDGTWTDAGDSLNAVTTYVTDFGAAPNFSNTKKVSNHLDYNTSAYGYSHDYDAYGFAATTVWFGVCFDTMAVTDTVVIDYGAPVTIHPLTNDIGYAAANAQVTGLALGKDADPDGEFETASVTGRYGTMTIAPNGDDLIYTPADMQMTGIDYFTYRVKEDAISGMEGTHTANILVVPAANMYFEEGFLSADGDWTAVGSFDRSQDEDRPGTYNNASIDANNNYGYDSSYLNDANTDSGGASIYAPANASKDHCKAEFTFTGTGCDIFSRTDAQGGTLAVTVYSGADSSDETKVLKRFMVNNYWGFEVDDPYEPYTDDGGNQLYDASGNPIMGDWQPAANSTYPTLYQIPVIKITESDLGGWGTWTVVLETAYLQLFDPGTLAASGRVYLDAVRTYDPAGVASGTVKQTDMDSGMASEIMEIYQQDHEFAPEFAKLKIWGKLDTEGKPAMTDPDLQTGVVLIDGGSNTGELDVYGSNAAAVLNMVANQGPNNEVYLAPGQSIAFKIQKNVTVTDGSYPHFYAQLAARVVYGPGSSNAMQVTSYASSTETMKTQSYRLTTATEMYYSFDQIFHTVRNSDGVVTSVVSATVVIKNTTSDSLLSLTNLKITSGAD